MNNMSFSLLTYKEMKMTTYLKQPLYTCGNKKTGTQHKVSPASRLSHPKTTTAAFPSAVKDALIFFASSKVSPTQWLRPRVHMAGGKRLTWGSVGLGLKIWVLLEIFRGPKHPKHSSEGICRFFLEDYGFIWRGPAWLHMNRKGCATSFLWYSRSETTTRCFQTWP